MVSFCRLCLLHAYVPMHNSEPDYIGSTGRSRALMSANLEVAFIIDPSLLLPSRSFMKYATVHLLVKKRTSGAEGEGRMQCYTIFCHKTTS